MSRTILLVDDDALMRRSLAFHLEQAGYNVHTAANAEDAISLVQRAAPDLVVLDIGLPGMDGLDALRELKAHENLPVIFLTGHAPGRLPGTPMEMCISQAAMPPLNSPCGTHYNICPMRATPATPPVMKPS